MNPDGAEQMFAPVKALRRTNATPFDADNDGDVDQADLGFFQCCVSGTGLSYGAGCGPADLDGRLKVGDKIVGVAQGEGHFEDIVDMKLRNAVKKIRVNQK